MAAVCFMCSFKVEEVDESDYPTEAPLHCQECNALSHPDCLPISSHTPLKGDVLFYVTCPKCSQDNQVQLERMRVSWLQVIHLVLFNLSVRESGRQGFFRWRDDICSFIEKHWTALLLDKVKTNNWTSTIAGTLSINCPKLFKSGQQVFKEPGWWALQTIKPPPRNYDESVLKRPKPKPVQNDPVETILADTGLGRGRRKRKIVSYRNEVVRPSKYAVVEEPRNDASLEVEKHAKSEVATSKSNESVKLDSKYKNVPGTSDPFAADLFDSKLDNDLMKSLSSENIYEDSLSCDFLSFDDSCALINTEEFSRVLSSSEKLSECDSEGNMPVEEADHTSTCYADTSLSCKMADFAGQEPRKRIPVSRFRPIESADERKGSLVSMTLKQEEEFLRQIELFPAVLASDAATRRLRRQLILRKRKRELDLPLFDLDTFVFEALKKSAPPEVQKRMFRKKPKSGEDIPTFQHVTPNTKAFHHPALEGVNVLDRFRSVDTSQPDSGIGHPYRSFKSRLVGRDHELYTRSIVSPYTGRVLKPYIRRDFDCNPPKVQILRELLNVTHRGDAHWVAPCRSSVDYCYVQPHHIPAVNAMCREFFWPGIDLTECLQYPDFSCVALYKKIVVGFAFLVPDVKYNEAYISFILVHPDFRRVGMAKFFIYHLIQTCMGKDVTLHVSASNSSMLLYQKFGFKVEELVLNFYDKYLPADSPESRHAFFLRLQR